MKKVNAEISMMLLIGSMMMGGFVGFSNESQSVPVKDDLTVQTDQSTANRIVNGDFESEEKAAGSTPHGWGMYQANTFTEGEIVLDNLVKYEGVSSLHFINSKHNIEQRIRVTAGERYTASCFFKSGLTKGACGLQVQFLDENGKWARIIAPESQKGKPWVAADGTMVATYNCNMSNFPDWKKAELDILVPEAAKTAIIAIQPVFSAQGEFWVDKVEMIPVAVKKSTGPLKSLVTIGKTDNPPVLDGSLGDACWDNATEISHFSVPVLKALASTQTKVRILHDKNAVYFGIQCDEPTPDKLVLNAKHRDDPAVYMDDCVEILLNPGRADKKQFHFLINAKGQFWDRTEIITSTGIKADENLNIAANGIVASIGKDSWTVEARLPFAELGIAAPSDLETWGFNVVRNKRTTSAESSSWSALDGNYFQMPAFFGRLVFADKAPAIKLNGITGQQASFFVKNQTVQNISIDLSIDLAEGTSLLPIAQEKSELKASEKRLVPLKLKQFGAGMFWSSVSSGGQVLFREGFVPLTKYAAIGWYDPQNVLGNKLYIASDMPRSFRAFNTTHNFEGGFGNPKLILRDKEPVDLYFELPREIRAVTLFVNVGGWQTWDPLVPAAEEGFTYDGREYVRYKFELPGILNYPVAEGPYAVFFETSLPPGSKSMGFCYLKWKGGQQAAKVYDIEVVEVGRTKPFKNFISGIYYAAPEFLLNWIPENLGALFPRLGLNTVEFEKNPGTYAVGPKIKPMKSRVEWYDMLAEQMEKGKLFGSTELTSSTPYFQGWTTYSKDADPDSRAIDVKGAPVMDTRYSDCYSPCPTYRGRKFQEWISQLKNSIVFSKYKLSWLSLDNEFWDEKAWNEGCFCLRCLGEYTKYADNNNPAERAADPLKFMLDPSANSNEAKIWQEFRNSTKAAFGLDVRKSLEDVIRKHGGQTGPKPGMIMSDWHWPAPSLFSAYDYFEGNLYYGPTEVARRLGLFMDSSKGRKNVIGSLSCGQSCSEDSFLTCEDLRYKIFECASAGVQGIRWHHIMAFDALKLKNMVDGMRAIQPFENIILDGEYCAEIPCEGKGASSRGMKLDNESLIIVRAYETKDKVTASITAPCREQSVVFDCYTGEYIGEISPEKTQILIPIDIERARLLYIGPKANLIDRQK